MAYTNEGPFTMTAGEDLAAYRLVKISSGEAVYADGGDEPIGVVRSAVSDGDNVAVWPLRGGIETVTAADAITDGAALYTANDGKVSDSANGNQIGVNMNGSSASSGETFSAILWNVNGANDYRTVSATSVQWIEDFISGALEDGSKFSETADKADWLKTSVDTDSDAGDVCSISDDAPGGWLTLTTNDHASDSEELQLNGEAFKLATGKPLELEARLMVADADVATWFIGLAITDTTVMAGATDRVGFQCDNDGNIDALVEQDTTESKTDTGEDIADGSLATASTKAVVLKFAWDGAGTVRFYVDGVLKTTQTDNGTTVVIPDDEAMTPTIALKNSSAAANTLYVDYIAVNAERI